MTLLPCAACERHIDSAAPHCPFCGQRFSSRASHTRAVAVLMVLLAGCDGDGIRDVQPMYGAPSPTTTSGTGGDGGSGGAGGEADTGGGGEGGDGGSGTGGDGGDGGS